MLPYVLIGLFCGLGGLIWSARLGSAAATLGNGFEMDAIAAVVIGVLACPAVWEPWAEHLSAF